MADFKVLKSLAGEWGDKAMKALSVPQKYASKKAAELAGLKPGESSESNFQALVEKGAEKIGIPEDSTAGNVAKSLAVAGAEVFADPLGFIPIGKIAKGIKGLSGMAHLPALAHIAEAGKAVKAAPAVETGLKKVAEEAGSVVLANQARAKQLDELAKVLKPKDMQFITSESSAATKTAEKWEKAAANQAARQTENAPIPKNVTAYDALQRKGAEKAIREKGMGQSKDFEKLVDNYMRYNRK